MTRFALVLTTLLVAGSAAVYAQDDGKKKDATVNPPEPPKTAGDGVRVTPEQVPDCVKAMEKFKAGDAKGCMDLLESAAAGNRALPPATVMFAAALLTTNQVPAGKALLERAAIERKDHPEVHRVLGELAFAEGRLSDSAVQFDRALALANSEVWKPKERQTFLYNAYAGLANVAEKRGDWDMAHAYLYALYKMESENTKFRWRLGRALFFRNQPDDAVTQLRQAAAKDKTLEPAELTMAGLWNQKRDFAKAEKWMQDALEANPKDVRVHVGFAQFLTEQNRYDDAAKAVAKAVDIDSKSPGVLLVLGVIARARKDFAAAEQAVQQVVTQFPSDFGAKNQLALILAEQDDPVKKRRASEIAAENAKLYPQGLEAITTLGWAQFRAGAVDEAEKTLGAALRTGQASSDCAYYLGLVYLAKKKESDARNLFEAALKAPGTFIHRADCEAELKKLPPAKKP